MKKYFIFALFFTIVGGNQLNAQSINYRTLSAEQIQAMAEQKRQQYDDVKSRADKTKDEFKNAKKEYKAKQKEYKELNKLRKQRKKELKEVEKALKLRSKLRKLSNELHEVVAGVCRRSRVSSSLTSTHSFLFYAYVALQTRNDYVSFVPKCPCL